MPVDYAIGLCDRCGRPVVKPECVIEGAARCLCPEPDLWTWEMLAADTEWEDERDRLQRERDAHVVIKPDNFRIWKKRVKNL